MALSVSVVLSLDSEALLDEKVDCLDFELALRVVYLHDSVGRLSGNKDVLVKDTGHRGVTLITAAPCLDVLSLTLGVTCLERGRFLSDSEHLLVLHLIVRVCRVQHSFQEILDLSLGLLRAFLRFRVERRGDAVWELRLELDHMIAWLDDAIWEMADRFDSF